jgi:hypothetical protein
MYTDSIKEKMRDLRLSFKYSFEEKNMMKIPDVNPKKFLRII